MAGYAVKPGMTRLADMKAEAPSTYPKMAMIDDAWCGWCATAMDRFRTGARHRLLAHAAIPGMEMAGKTGNQSSAPWITMAERATASGRTSICLGNSATTWCSLPRAGASAALRLFGHYRVWRRRIHGTPPIARDILIECQRHPARRKSQRRGVAAEMPWSQTPEGLLAPRWIELQSGHCTEEAALGEKFRRSAAGVLAADPMRRVDRFCHAHSAAHGSADPGWDRQVTRFRIGLTLISRGGDAHRSPAADALACI